MAAFRKPGPQERTPTTYRLLAVLAGVLLWAFDLLGVLTRSSFWYFGVAIVALLVAGALFSAKLRVRGRQSTTTTGLLGGLFVLLTVVAVALAIALGNIVEFRLASLVLALLLGILLVGIGSYGQSDAQPSVEDRDELGPEEERQRIADLAEVTRAQRERRQRDGQ